MLQKQNYSKSVIKDLSIGGFSDSSYEFFCKSNNTNLVPAIKANNILTVGLGDESKITLQGIINAFAKIDFKSLPNKVIYLLIDSLSSSENNLSELVDNLSLYIILMFTNIQKIKKS